MDLLNLRKKTDREIANPIVRNEAKRYSERTRLAFLPDEVIGRSWYFRLLTLMYYYVFTYFHGFESKSHQGNASEMEQFILRSNHKPIPDIPVMLADDHCSSSCWIE